MPKSIHRPERDPWPKFTDANCQWHNVYLGTAALMRLAGVSLTWQVDNHHTLAYMASLPRDRILRGVSEFVQQHRSNGGGGVAVYLGQNVATADFRFERTADATLFKLTHG